MSKQPRIVKHDLIAHHLNGLKSPSASEVESRCRMKAMCDLVALESTRELSPKKPDPGANGMHLTEIQCVVISIMGRYNGLEKSLERFLPGTEMGYICFTEPGDNDPQRYHAELPALGPHSLVFLCDLVLDSTSPMRSVLRIVKSHGAQQIKCLSLFATRKETRRLLRIHRDLGLFCALLDKDASTDGNSFPFHGIPHVELPASRTDS